MRTPEEISEAVKTINERIKQERTCECGVVMDQIGEFSTEDELVQFYQCSACKTVRLRKL